MVGRKKIRFIEIGYFKNKQSNNQEASFNSYEYNYFNPINSSFYYGDDMDRQSLMFSINSYKDVKKISKVSPKYINLTISNPDIKIIDYFMKNGNNFLYADFSILIWKFSPQKLLYIYKAFQRDFGGKGFIVMPENGVVSKDVEKKIIAERDLLLKMPPKNI